MAIDEQTPPPSKPKAPGWLLLLESLCALLVALAFGVALMTATAQQRVVATLDAQHLADPKTPALDYSTAWARVKSAISKQSEIDLLSHTAETDSGALQQEQTALNNAGASLDDAWAALRPAVRLAAKASCSIGDTNAVAIPARYQVWTAVQGCLRAGDIPKATQDQIAAASPDSGNYSSLYDTWRRDNQLITNTQAQLIDLKTKIAERNAEIQAASPLRDAFNEMNVLRDHWLLGHGIFLDVPPSLMQIILAFFSGTFGALLVTLILVVYPNNQIAASAGSDYAARLFLGGLISIGVYIILAGGSAVLGTQAGFDQSHANYMTFCAVGVLAGMFSDRTAAWISRRADAFFAR